MLARADGSTSVVIVAKWGKKPGNSEGGRSGEKAYQQKSISTSPPRNTKCLPSGVQKCHATLMLIAGRHFGLRRLGHQHHDTCARHRRLRPVNSTPRGVPTLIVAAPLLPIHFLTRFAYRSKRRRASKQAIAKLEYR